MIQIVPFISVLWFHYGFLSVSCQSLFLLFFHRKREDFAFSGFYGRISGNEAAFRGPVSFLKQFKER